MIPRTGRIAPVIPVTAPASPTVRASLVRRWRTRRRPGRPPRTTLQHSQIDDVGGVWEPDPVRRHQIVVQVRGADADRPELVAKIAAGATADSAARLARLDDQT